MIYGKGSKGNYNMLSKLAGRLPVFPDIANERSMLYIENLCEFVRLMIENDEDGIFFPQNEEYVRTSNMVKMIGQSQGRRIHLLKGLNPVVWCLGKIPGKTGRMVNKAFGSLVYEKDMSIYPENYWMENLRNSILKTERDLYA